MIEKMVDLIQKFKALLTNIGSKKKLRHERITRHDLMVLNEKIEHLKCRKTRSKQSSGSLRKSTNKMEMNQ